LVTCITSFRTPPSNSSRRAAAGHPPGGPPRVISRRIPSPHRAARPAAHGRRAPCAQVRRNQSPKGTRARRGWPRGLGGICRAAGGGRPCRQVDGRAPRCAHAGRVTKKPPGGRLWGWCAC